MCSRARARSGSVTQRCHNSPRWETGLASANDVRHRERGGFWEILKKSVSRVETRHRARMVDFRLLAEALGRCRTRWGVQIKRGRIEGLCLSLSLSLSLSLFLSLFFFFLSLSLLMSKKTFKLKSNEMFRTWTEKS